METWEEIYEQYHTDEYPVFGGPFTNALTFKEWLEVCIIHLFARKWIYLIKLMN